MSSHLHRARFLDLRNAEGRAPVERPSAQAIDWSSDRGREAGLQALHAQGDPRAAAGAQRLRDVRATVARTGAPDVRGSTASNSMSATFGASLILACGTSWHAALCGKHLIERLARIPVEVDLASEFRYRDPIVGQTAISRSRSLSRGRRPTPWQRSSEAKAPRGPDASSVQRGRLDDRARRRPRHLHPCRTQRSASPRPRRSPASSSCSASSRSTLGKRAGSRRRGPGSVDHPRAAQHDSRGGW